jgi:hypothetical protein
LPALRSQQRSSAPRCEPRVPPFPTWRGSLAQVGTAAPRSPISVRRRPNNCGKNRFKATRSTAVDCYSGHYPTQFLRKQAAVAVMSHSTCAHRHVTKVRTSSI